MDNHKKLNKNKFMNNKRYKNRKYARSEETSPLNEVNKSLELSKNWARYDEIEEDPTAPEGRPYGMDFGLLSQGPVSQGSYFQFKKDRYFLPSTDTKPEIDDIFKLDLNKISMAIKSVPFYKRIGLNPSVFKEVQIAEMNEEALKNATAYESFVKSSENSDTNEVEKYIEEDQFESCETTLDDISTIDDYEEDSPCGNPKDGERKHLESWLEDLLK